MVGVNGLIVNLVGIRLYHCIYLLSYLYVIINTRSLVKTYSGTKIIFYVFDN